MINNCELPAQNASPNEIADIIRHTKRIAVVGISSNPEKASYRVAKYLRNASFEIVPVNPTLTEWEGIKAYADLKDIPGAIDIVDIFRRPEDVPPVVDAAIAKKAKVVWMQQGIVHNAAADKARAAGLQVVMDKCLLVEHRNL